MAAPICKNLNDLNGKWRRNPELSTDLDAVLKMQNFNYLLRRSIPKAPVYVTITQTDEQLVFKQTTTGNIPAITEVWNLNWQDVESKNFLMGKFTAKGRWVHLDEVEGEADREFMIADGWLDDGNAEDGRQIEAYLDGIDQGYIGRHVWGFEMFEGQRYFTRRVVVRMKKTGQMEMLKMVYDYVSE